MYLDSHLCKISRFSILEELSKLDNKCYLHAAAMSNKSIVDKKVSIAINQLKISQKRVSKNVLKVLNAAIANAENNKQLDIDNLFVKEAFVGKSLRMKRWRPRAKGRAGSIIKPFSKITIILEERTKKEEDK